MKSSWIGSFIDGLPQDEVLKICRYHGLDEPDEGEQSKEETQQPPEPAVLVREYCEDYPSVANCIEVAQTFGVDYSKTAEILEGTGGLLTLSALNEIQSLAKVKAYGEVIFSEILNVDIMKLLSKEETRDFIPVPITGCFVLTDGDLNNGSQYSTQIVVKKIDRSYARTFSGKTFSRGLFDVHIRIQRSDVEDCPVVEFDKKILMYQPNETNNRKSLNAYEASLIASGNNNGCGGGNMESIDVSSVVKNDDSDNE